MNVQYTGSEFGQLFIQYRKSGRGIQNGSELELSEVSFREGLLKTVTDRDDPTQLRSIWRSSCQVEIAYSWHEAPHTRAMIDLWCSSRIPPHELSWGGTRDEN